MDASLFHSTTALFWHFSSNEKRSVLGFFSSLLYSKFENAYRKLTVWDKWDKKSFRKILGIHRIIFMRDRDCIVGNTYLSYGLIYLNYIEVLDHYLNNLSIFCYGEHCVHDTFLMFEVWFLWLKTYVERECTDTRHSEIENELNTKFMKISNYSSSILPFLSKKWRIFKVYDFFSLCNWQTSVKESNWKKFYEFIFQN